MTEEEAKRIFENETFISLMAAAQDDKALKSRMLDALRSDDMTRVSIIKQWVSSSTDAGAPLAFIEALSYLVHGRIAAKALEALN